MMYVEVKNDTITDTILLQWGNDGNQEPIHGGKHTSQVTNKSLNQVCV